MPPKDDLAKSLREDVFPGNLAAFDELSNLVSSGDIIPFVGAGASVPNLPTWSNLLQQLLAATVARGLLTSEDDISELTSLITTDPLSVAATLESIFTPGPFREVLSEMVGEGSASFTETHSLIVRLNPRFIVTLNYDYGIENAYAHRYKRSARCLDVCNPSDVARCLQLDRTSSETLSVMHLHGQAGNPQSIIFTSTDYSQLYSDSNNRSALAKLWTSNRLLAIGFGFADPFLKYILNQNLIPLASASRHFAFIGRKDCTGVGRLTRQTFAREFRLSPIFYSIAVDKEGHEDHSALSAILSLLIREDDAVEPAALEPQAANPPPIIIDQRQFLCNLAQRDFDEALLSAPISGAALYVEPRFIVAGADSEKHLHVDDIINSSESYMVMAQTERGASTCGRRLLADLLKAGKTALLKNANDLPAYRRKLETEIRNDPHFGDNLILILDNFSCDRHERLLKEMVGLNLVCRYIIFASINKLHRAAIDSIIENLAIAINVVELDTLDRQDIRCLSRILLDTVDEEAVRSLVDNSYRDLLDLCVPLTPSNVIMYLSIVAKDGDFRPLNRVEIVSQYINQLLKRPSDIYRDSFNISNKIDVLSKFVFECHRNGKTFVTESEWYEFCRAYMHQTLVMFDERHLLNDLISARILILNGREVSFRYRVFYTYFLAYAVAGRQETARDFIRDDRHLSVMGLVEMISGLSPDNTMLLSDLVSKNRIVLDEFTSKYGLGLPDPFARVEWPIAALDDEKVWRPITKLLSDGPAGPPELDSLKRSLIAEKRTDDQTVVLQSFDAIESRLIANYAALVGALKCSDGVNGQIKKEAIGQIGELASIFYRVGLMFAPLIASHKIFVWNGMVYYNLIEYTPEVSTDKSKQTVVVMQAMASSIIHSLTDSIGTKKLSEVFRLISLTTEPGTFEDALMHRLILRSKPSGWEEVVSTIIRRVNMTSFYLAAMLTGTLREFRQEIATTREREAMKRVIALIRVRRELKHKNPGLSLVKKIAATIEDQGGFNGRTEVAPQNTE